MTKCPNTSILFKVIFLVLLCCPTKTLYGATLPEKCRLEPVNGMCKALMDKYFFDQEAGRCKKYIYDGCGPVVPFDTLEDCRALCESANSIDDQVRPPGAKSGEKERSGLNYDPVEDDPRYADVFKTIDNEVKESLAKDQRPRRRGFVHIFWATKKRLLKEKYGIDWRTPGEMNPWVIFD